MLRDGNNPLNTLLICIQHGTTNSWKSRKESDQLSDILLTIIIQIGLGNICHISYNNIKLLGMRICIKSRERCDGLQHKCIPQVASEEGNEDIHDGLDVGRKEVGHPSPHAV